MLERLGAEMTADLKGGALSTKGVSFGSAGARRGVAADSVVRPFGRGRWATLDDAIAQMGKQALGVELPPAERKALAGFVRSLPEPIFLPPDAASSVDLYNSWMRGKRAFEEIGCAGCHVPEMRLQDGTIVRAFTDLRTHDMGADLAGKQGREWLTAPLWGLSDTAPWLHDGRALASIDDAILAHGGEAKSSGDRFGALAHNRKGDVRVFLLSLARKPRIQIAGE